MLFFYTVSKVKFVILFCSIKKKGQTIDRWLYKMLQQNFEPVFLRK